MESTASITTVHRECLAWMARVDVRKYLVGMLLGTTLFGTCVTTVRAEVDRWASYGPLGGFSGSIVFDPQNPSTVYVTGYGLVFKSGDGGANWHALSPESTPGGIDRLLIDPSNSSTMYAESARSGGVFKSTDGGLNWTAVHIPSDSYGISGTYWTLALDPRNPTTIYAGSFHYDSDGGDLFKSTDGGTSWRRTPLRSNDGNGILDVVVDPQDTEVLYAGFPYHLYQSIDGGETWREATGFPSFGALSIAIDPLNPSSLYVRTYTDVYKSTDRGNSWSLVPALGYISGTLLVDPQDSRTIYAAGSREGLLKSSDGGSTWTASNSGLPANGIYGLALDPTNHNTVYVGTTRGLFKSTDGGSNWSSTNSGLTNTWVSTVAVDAQNSGIAYAATSERIFKSTDGAREMD